jgi:hypothetical protein
MRLPIASRVLAILSFASLAAAGCSSSSGGPASPGTDAGSQGSDASSADASPADAAATPPTDAGGIVSESGVGVDAGSTMDAAASASDASDSGSASAGIFVSINNGLATAGVVYGYPAAGGSPTVTIYPSDISQIGGMAFDASGALYLASVNETAAYNGIAVLPAHSSGASTPTRFITGTSTLLQHGIGAMAVTPSGDIYMYQAANDQVIHFGPTADGNATPDVSLMPVPGSTMWAYSTSFTPFTVDSTRSLAYINGGQVIGAFPLGTSGTQAPSSVNLGPPNDAGFGFGAAAMTCDTSGNLYTVSQDEVMEFAPDPSGMAVPTKTWPAPTFTGGSLAVDSAGRVYFFTSNGTSTALSVVAPGSSAPVLTIQGAELTNPSYVATTL